MLPVSVYPSHRIRTGGVGPRTSVSNESFQVIIVVTKAGHTGLGLDSFFSHLTDLHRQQWQDLSFLDFSALWPVGIGLLTG